MDAIENEHNTSAGDGVPYSEAYILELMRSNGIDHDHNTSAEDDELCSDSIHRRRKNSNVGPMLVDDARQTAYIGGGRIRM